MCVLQVARARQGRPGDALAGGNTFPVFSPHTHTHAHGPPRQVAERGANKPKTHTMRRSLYSQIARASRARSCEHASSAGSEGAAWRAEMRGEKDREHGRTANRDKGKRTSRSAPARRVRHTARRVRRAPARCVRASPAGGFMERSAKGVGARAEQGGAPRTAVSREHGPRAPRARGARTPHALRASRRELRAPRAREWHARPRRAAERGRGARETTQRDSRATVVSPGLRNPGDTTGGGLLLWTPV